MQKFFDGKPPVRFTDCVMVFRHVYDQTHPERAMRDHDNIEVNMVSDIVALYVLPDDSPRVCTHYYCSAAGPEERTEIYIAETGFSDMAGRGKSLPGTGGDSV